MLVAAGLTAGCAGQSGSQIPYAAPGLAGSNGTSLHRGSFLYVSDAGTNDVQVYGWPKPKSPVATLTGFSEPQGECADSSGNVFITNTGARNVLEYKGGATSPSQALADPDGLPVGCSSDPSSGNLAVSNIVNNSYGQGNIDMYTRASGKPHLITSRKLFKPYSLQYDGSGNLFIIGINAQYSQVYAELPAGSKRIKIICQSLHFPSFGTGIAWDGNYIVLGGTKGSQFGVYRMNKCKQVGFTPLDDASDIAQIVIDGDRLVAADAGDAGIEIYDYPKGGSNQYRRWEAASHSRSALPFPVLRRSNGKSSYAFGKEYPEHRGGGLDACRLQQRRNLATRSGSEFADGNVQPRSEVRVPRD